MSAFIKVFVTFFVIGCLLVGAFYLMHSYPALGALCVVFIIAFVSTCIITYDGNRKMKDRIGFMFFLAIVFTMCAVAVKVLLLIFGTGLLGISLSCLALAFMLFILLYGTNPK